ncbi:bifunctional diaminohydroxyphosphoribosylaminopyrimidine deaminase/5-amino-6-(5-phosphoribosylamino)uracil reductase RibD [Halanaerobiaceae bacterium Z-7014]|uniref:Riboflavin biosynthesis protein RibD n=1 Tax=Halonatronomonas betaini TaxID=2778430 RepID=A0A931AUL8_9FIRM|nr:bifunctional diaminohydroxyphosphoribosylaminopyrimidine deaminase/5-amino-6-(5-phosphoribosylamino)uracil reductase RibD [Halonatronomonas betaini]MBF8436805.1 bifunctional diaminohydroxyphosphoribosylaminopyrimidine deaminase/5-amino-6-(5-phosphoribosylamino)uracil reductase RibD [Halonatronomonas betaini]
MEFRDKDYKYMERALELARKGEGFVSPNPLVGAVIVKDDKIIGKGYHSAFGEDHAEVMAIDSADTDVKGSDLYVNLEPCSHYGKTPPCSLKVINSGIKRVFIANGDPNPKVAGGGISQLKEKDIEVYAGLMEEEGRKLNESFFHFMEKKRPFYNLKVAQTIDGYIAAPGGDARWISGEKSREYAHYLRHKLDAVLVGRGTAELDDPQLTVRHLDGKVSQPTRVILDSNLKISLESKLFKEARKGNYLSDILVFTGPDVDAVKKSKFQELPGVKVIELALNEDNQLDLDDLSRELINFDLINILLEGGSRINYSFLKAGLIDKYYIFISPKILGGNDGIPVFAGAAPDKIYKSEKINIDKTERYGEDILITAYPKRGES